MESKFCTQWNIEKLINIFYKNFSECKDCNIKRCVKRYYDNKDKKSMPQKLYYEKKRDKLLQKQNEYSRKRRTDCKEIQRSYVKLQNKLKALQEKIKINNSEKH